jgi:hypothetical protein
VQAQNKPVNLTPEQIKAKEKLEKVFSCEKGWEKVDVISLLKIYGIKKENKDDSYTLKNPLNIFGLYSSTVSVFGSSEINAKLSKTSQKQFDSFLKNANIGAYEDDYYIRNDDGEGDSRISFGGSKNGGTFICRE